MVCSSASVGTVAHCGVVALAFGCLSVHILSTAAKQGYSSL